MVLAKNSTNKHQKPIKAIIFVTSKNRSSTMLRGCSFVTALSTLAIPLWGDLKHTHYTAMVESVLGVYFIFNEKTRKSKLGVRIGPQHISSQGRTEDFVIEGAQRYSIQRQLKYGRDSTHQDCERRTFLGSFGRMLRGKF